MNELAYKGFTGSVNASIEDNCLIGEVLFINDRIIYEGQTIAEIKTAFEVAIDQYLEYCARHNKQPSKPYSGTFNVRTGPELHRLAAKEAYKSGKSLNEYIVQSIKNNITGNYYNANSPVAAFNWANVNQIVDRPIIGTLSSQASLQNIPQQKTELVNRLISGYTQ